MISQLPLYQPRKFVPAQVNLSKPADLMMLYQKLVDQSIDSAKDLEQWIYDRSELEAAVDQEGSLLYIAMTCQTDDPSKSDAYKHFIEQVVPVVKPLEDQLNKKFLESVKKYPLDLKRFEIYYKFIKTDVELFVEKNIPLQTQVQLLSQEYQTICGAMTVTFEGKEYTLPQMSKFLMLTDRVKREGAWKAISERRLRDKDKLENIFDQMLKLRVEIAQNASCVDFIQYQFRGYHRFDYTPEDCKKFHQAVETKIIPLWRKIQQKRKKELNLTQLRPWDLSVDPLGRDALKPFDEIDQFINGTKEIFNRTNRELGAQFEEMARLGLLDLASRKGKAPGGYQQTLNEFRKPFIFMNAVGIDDDVRTLLHEGGHAFHALASAHDPVFPYRHAPMEFCEVASMAMELLAGEYIDVFYPKKEDVDRSKREHLEGIIHLFVWVAIVDSFQFWIYENPKHTSAQRKEAWLKITKRFSDGVTDWSGFEEQQAFMWHRQLHIFEVPFYYIEYAIAQLGALQLWVKGKKNLNNAIADYRRGLALGGSRPLKELFGAAGIRFDFSEETIAPLIEEVKIELDKFS